MTAPARHTPLTVAACPCRSYFCRHAIIPGVVDFQGVILRDDAEHIVHAVNTYPAILAALRETTSLLADYISDAGGCDHSVGICMCGDLRALETSRAALAQAEGGTK